VRLAVAIAIAVGTTTPVSADAVSAPLVALTVSPARAVLRAPTSRTLQLVNGGTGHVAVDVAWKSLGPHIAPSRWLSIAPRHFVLRSGARAILTVRAGPGASPGDHELLVLVTGRPVDRSRVAVQLRVGVRLRIRAPGRLVHKLAVEGLRTGRFKGKRTLLVSVANYGNVTEQLRGRLTVTLLAHGRIISRMRLGRSHELGPATRAVVVLPYSGGARGVVTAVVRVRLGSHLRPLERRYRLSLRLVRG
jgi:hypothetical protein